MAPTPKPSEHPPGPRPAPVHLPPNAPKRNGPIEREYKDISNPTRTQPGRPVSTPR